MKQNIIDALIENAPERLKASLQEARDEINEAIAEAADNAEENDSESIVVNIPFAMRLDLGKNGITYKLTVTRKTTFESTQPLDDKEQGKLL